VRKWYSVPCVTVAMILVYKKEVSTTNEYTETIMITKPRRIFFQIENFDTLEEFCKDMEEEYDEVTFSNSFSWIWVYTIDENGKKTKLFEYETA